MPDSYDFIDAAADVDILGSAVTRNVMRVTALAKPSGVVWVSTIPIENYTAEFVGTALTRQAGVFNTAAAHRNVVGLSTIQDVGINNQFIDLAIVTLTSTSGKTLRDYRAGYAVLEGAVFDEWVASRVATLDAVEAG